MVNLDRRLTWNGEPIITSFDYPPIPIRSFDWSATLDGYDPTPWDSETPATGIHAICESGQSEAQAICNLIERIMEQ